MQGGAIAGANLVSVTSLPFQTASGPVPAPADNAPALNTSFQAATNNAEYIPAGVYNLAQVLQGTPGRFVGAGQDKTILRLSPSATSGVWLAQNLPLFELENLTLDCNAPNTVDGGNNGAQYGLYVSATTIPVVVSLRHVKIINSWHIGLYMFGSGANTVTARLYDVTVTNCGQSASGGNGVFGHDMVATVAEGLFVSNNPIVGATNATVSFTGSNGINLTDFEVNNNGSAAGNAEGLAFSTDGANIPCTNLELVNGQCNGNLGAWGLALSIHTANFKVANVQANGNTSGGGITIDVRAGGDVNPTPAYGSVVNCEGSNNGSNHGLNVNYAQYVAISGGQFNGNANASSSGINLGAVNCTVENCHAHGNGFRGITVNGVSTTTLGAHTIVGNDVTGNPTGYGESASPAPAPSYVRHNPGYNPVGSVAPAVPASGTAVGAVSYDRTFYVTAAAGGATMAIQGGPSVVVPASALGTVRVPAGQTVTPTYTTAPAWVVEGE